jgi:hypothetical protein
VTTAERQARLLEAQQLINARIRALAVGPLPALRSCGYAWEETALGAFNLVLYRATQRHHLPFNEAELVEGAGGEEGRKRVEEKVEGFLSKVINKETERGPVHE